MSSNLALRVRTGEGIKIIDCAKDEEAIDHIIRWLNTRRDFAPFQRTLKIGQGSKERIPRPCFKPCQEICRVALKDRQDSSVSDTLASPVTFTLPKYWKITTVVGSTGVVGALTCYALLHFVCDLKDAQIYVQHNLRVKVDHEAAEIKKKYCTKATINAMCEIDI